MNDAAALEEELKMALQEELTPALTNRSIQQSL